MKKIESLSEYIDAIKRIESKWETTTNNFILYRGQSDSTWNLRPGIYRDYEQREAQERQFPEYMLKRFLTSSEINSLNGFIQKGIFFDKSLRNSSKLEWYFLSQHYGLKTRLLDWSTSYLIALFFALEKAVKGIPAAVFILDPKWLNFQYHFIEGSSVLAPFVFDRDIPLGLFDTIEPDLSKANLDLMSYINFESRNFHPFPIAIKPMPFDERMYHQKSYFTINGNIHNFFDLILQNNNHELLNKKAIAKYLYSILSFNLFDGKEISKELSNELQKVISINLKNVEYRFGKQKRLAKILIDDTKIDVLKAELRKAGIDNTNIYPGFEGLAQDMNEMFNKNLII